MSQLGWVQILYDQQLTSIGYLLSAKIAIETQQFFCPPKPFCISVYDGEEYPVKRSRNVDEIMADVGQCEIETLYVRHVDKDGATGTRVGGFTLVYGNGGWDVIADHTDNPLMHELLAKADFLADQLGNLL